MTSPMEGSGPYPDGRSAARPAPSRELEEITRGWHAAAVPLPEQTVPARFADRVRVTPGSIAIEYGEARISYAELDDRSSRLASRIAALGVRPGEAVGVAMRRSAHLVVALLAVAKAGAAYVPLDSRDPASRQSVILGKAGCGLVVTDSELAEADLLAGRGQIRADLADTDDEPAVARIEDLTASPDALLYVMHTSGSTGEPKGVAVTHRNVIALVADRSWRNGRHQRVLMHSPHAFDASTYEIWVPLLSGGTVVVAPEPLDAGTLRELAGTGRITAAFLTCGLLETLAEADPACFNGISELWTGGDVVTAGPVMRVRDACPDTRIVIAYGPTETTTYATSYLVPPELEADRSLPLGTPLDNTRVYVLDGELRLVPTETIGLAYIAGAGVARGYLNQPGLTAQRFLPDPFGAAGERMYATGDLASRQPDGNLRFHGREDGQFKLNGYRIETGEIEAALAAHPDVSRAVVIARKFSDGAGRIIAHVVPPDPAAPPDAVALMSYLADRLPDYMVPAEICFLAEFPLTPNGKVDRASLAEGTPGQDHQAPAATADEDSPATQSDLANDLESRVAAIWAVVLGTDEIGLDDKFMECGGTSLKMIGLHSRLCREFAKNLPIQRLFQFPTVRTMARYLGQSDGSQADPTGEALGLDERAAARRGRLQARQG